MAKSSKNQKKRFPVRDRHYLYSAAVQSVDPDLDFFRKVYRKHNGRMFTRLREDFCGTALLAREFVRRKPAHRAWGVDLCRETLAWGDRHYDAALGEARERLELIRGDVLEVSPPRVDVAVALNFSYSVFKDRETLGSYFRRARKTLDDDGIFFLDAWGGTETMDDDMEKRKIPAEDAFDGTHVPAFTYVWEQKRFNPVDHGIHCNIHFKLPDGTRMKNAFSYDWRLWTLPELQELLRDAGFAETAVYVEGWDDDEDEADGIFRRRTYFENQEGWVAYVVAHA
jgi:hypothetical protein